MPRGNAPTDTAELADLFGSGQGRADDLIEAARERYSPEMEAAQLKNLDENASALLDKREVAEAAGVKPEAIESAGVRGDKVIAVVSDSDGRVSKVLLDLSTFGMEPDEEVADTVVFASDAAQKAAEAKNLTPERILAELGGLGSGKNGTITTKDVKAAAEKVAHN